MGKIIDFLEKVDFLKSTNFDLYGVENDGTLFQKKFLGFTSIMFTVTTHETVSPQRPRKRSQYSRLPPAAVDFGKPIPRQGKVSKNKIF